MNLFRLSATIMAASLWISAACSGRTIYVSTTGTNNPPYTNWADATTNILWAVNATTTSNGDTVLINNGTYVLTNYAYITKALRVQSVNGAGATIVDGNNATMCFYPANTGAVLDGLTITRGYAQNGGGVLAIYGGIVNCIISNNASWLQGGGIYLAAGGGAVTITNCIIANNISSNGGGICANSCGGLVTIESSTIIANVSTGNYGGGFACFYSKHTVTNTTFAKNSAYSGGGVYIAPWDNGTGTYWSCTFSNNSAVLYGGGLYVLAYPAYPHTIRNSTFISNSADYGGGIYFNNSRVNIQDSVICDNTSTNYGGGGVCLTFYAGIIKNCVISNNTALGTSNTRGGGGILITAGTGLVQNCTIVNNRAALGYGGGGISVRMNSAAGNGPGPTIRNCLIMGNTADTAVTYGGGGVFVYSAETLIQNCTIVSNFSTKTAGLYTSLGFGYTSTVANTVIYLNSGTGTYTNWYSDANSCFYSNSCVFPTNSLPGAGNIQSDPLFESPSTGNYRLGLNSPCVNRGLNMGWITDALDLDGRRRLDKFSGIVDIGCYERVPSGTLYKVW